jgi:hypothetical protein
MVVSPADAPGAPAEAMTTRGLPTLLALAALGCAARPPDPRAELTRAGVEYTADAFVRAAGAGDARGVSLFLQAGMDPDVTDGMGRTPLIAAASAGSTEVAAALLDRGARPGGCSASPAVGSASPLFAAAVRGQEAVVVLLLERGADPGERCLGTTAADEAARFLREGVVRQLVARGAEVTWDPLREAAREAAERWARVAENLRACSLVRGVIRGVLPRSALPEVEDRFVAHHTYLAQVLEVDVGSPAVLATSTTTFERPGPFALRVRGMGNVTLKGEQVALLAEDLQHEASRFVLDHARRDLHAPYLEYARSLLPRAVERVPAGLQAGPLSRADLALLVLPGVIELELRRTREASILAEHLPAFAQALGVCHVVRKHRLDARRLRGLLAPVWRSAFAPPRPGRAGEADRAVSAPCADDAAGPGARARRSLEECACQPTAAADVLLKGERDRLEPELAEAARFAAARPP